MQKDEQFVRIALQRGLFPFGIAFKKDGNEKWSYYVNQKQFYEYTGYYYQKGD